MTKTRYFLNPSGGNKKKSKNGTTNMDTPPYSHKRKKRWALMGAN